MDLLLGHVHGLWGGGGGGGGGGGIWTNSAIWSLAGE